VGSKAWKTGMPNALIVRVAIPVRLQKYFVYGRHYFAALPAKRQTLLFSATDARSASVATSVATTGRHRDNHPTDTRNRALKFPDQY
jgi:hypothetical protein